MYIQIEFVNKKGVRTKPYRKRLILALKNYQQAEEPGWKIVQGD